MSIKVRPLSQRWKAVIQAGEDVLEFSFCQLNYAKKSQISAESIIHRNGDMTFDHTKTVFLNIKYGLKSVKGLEDEDGKPYELKFESEDDCLEDECVEELLATEIGSELTFVSSSMDTCARLPDHVLHPMTNQPIPGVKILPDVDSKKKS